MLIIMIIVTTIIQCPPVSYSRYTKCMLILFLFGMCDCRYMRFFCFFSDFLHARSLQGHIITG